MILSEYLTAVAGTVLLKWKKCGIINIEHMLNNTERVDKMKINKISLGCQKTKAVSDEPVTNLMLLLFRTPVIIENTRNSIRVEGSSAMILTSPYGCSLHSADGIPARYDYISFNASNADRQYISSLALPVDEPIILRNELNISMMFRMMKTRSVTEGKNRSEYMELVMRLIFVALSDEIELSGSFFGTKIPHYHKLRELRSRIYDDPVYNWNTEEICSELGISRAYFHRLYLEAFGVSCRQDIIESRLLYASGLLKDTDRTITQIAEECGYESESYFMRQFKKHKGCTPTEFRRRLLKDEVDEQ